MSSRHSKAFGFTAGNILPRAAGIGMAGKLNYFGTKTMPERHQPANRTTGALQIIEPIKAAGVSRMGTPVFDIITLTNQDAGLSYTFDILPMVDISRAKKIVETEINGGPGEVVELISSKHWDVRLRGLLVDMQHHQFPLDQLQQLNDLFDVADTFKVESELLNAMGIMEVYFKDFAPQFLEGFRDTIGFTLTGKSHVPVEILLMEGF